LEKEEKILEKREIKQPESNTSWRSKSIPSGHQETETDVPRVQGPASSDATAAEDGAGPWTADGRREAETDGHGGGGHGAVDGERRTPWQERRWQLYSLERRRRWLCTWGGTAVTLASERSMCSCEKPSGPCGERRARCVAECRRRVGQTE